MSFFPSSIERKHSWQHLPKNSVIKIYHPQFKKISMIQVIFVTGVQQCEIVWYGLERFCSFILKTIRINS